MRRHTPDDIKTLEAWQVFVFGTNANGFHGAGAAGIAFRSESKNTWRNDPWFRMAMTSPVGSKERVGRWAVFGVARGLQKGNAGTGYGIETIKRPGELRSTPLSEIAAQLKVLFKYAREHPRLEFLVTKIGCGLAGYTKNEIFDVFARLESEAWIPENVLLPKELDPRS